MNYNQIDEAMLPLHQYIQKITGIEEGSITDTGMTMAMNVVSVQIETPFELDLQVDENGKVILGIAPPLYYVDTGVQPVFHHLNVTLAAEEPTEQIDYGS